MLRNIPDDRRKQILQRIREVAANPNNRSLDVRPLAGSELFRLRVGGYRVIFSVDNATEVLTVDSVGTRGDVYKK